jgi:hypothetical protein
VIFYHSDIKYPRVDSGQESDRIRQDSGRNPVGFRSDSGRIPVGFRSDSGRIPDGILAYPVGIIGEMKKYFILLDKDLFKQNYDFILYC